MYLRSILALLSVSTLACADSGVGARSAGTGDEGAAPADESQPCLRSSECDHGHCVAPLLNGSPGLFECRGECLGERVNTSYCGDSAACCDGLRCDNEGFCVPDPGPEGETGEGEGEGGEDDGSNETGGGGATGAEPEGSIRCQDRDRDGFGDPTDCLESLNAVPGMVDNSEDCDDGDAQAHPGAAALEGEACMRDRDSDGWGDSTASRGVTRGHDCHDDNADWVPDGLRLFAIGNDALYRVDPEAGTVTQGPRFRAYGSAIDPEDSRSRLQAATLAPNGDLLFDSGTTLMVFTRKSRCETPVMRNGSVVMEVPRTTPLPTPHGQQLCGLGFDGAGELWGVNPVRSELVHLDSETGATVDSVTLQDGGFAMKATSCDLSFDCVGDRLLLGTGSGRVYEVNTATGELSTLAETGQLWTDVGIAQAPLVDELHASVDGALVDIDTSGTNLVSKSLVEDLPAGVLQWAPGCQ